MEILKIIFNIWIAVSFVLGLFETTYFINKINTGSKKQRLVTIFCLGPFWWFILGYVYILKSVFRLFIN